MFVLLMWLCDVLCVCVCVCLWLWARRGSEVTSHGLPPLPIVLGSVSLSLLLAFSLVSLSLSLSCCPLSKVEHYAIKYVPTPQFTNGVCSLTQARATDSFHWQHAVKIKGIRGRWCWLTLSNSSLRSRLCNKPAKNHENLSCCDVKDHFPMLES